MLSKRIQTTLHKEKILFIVVLILLGQHCTGKILCHVPQEASDNIAQEKILFGVALIHCIGKMFHTILCMLPSSRQHCTEKS